MLPESEPPQPSTSAHIELDWRAYFLSFSETHGGNPIRFEGRLLFHDGWTYSASDYAGPEWPPPSDSKRLRHMQLFYWKARRAIVEYERKQLRNTLESLTQAQRARQIPLFHTVRSRTDEGETVSKSVPLNLSDYEERLHWLVQDVINCDEQLLALELAGMERLNESA